MSKRAKPVPRSSRVQALTDKTRATTLRRDKDDVKNVSVTLMDMDSAIMYYFENVIKPSVQENGESIKVPNDKDFITTDIKQFIFPGKFPVDEKSEENK